METLQDILVLIGFAIVGFLGWYFSRQTCPSCKNTNFTELDRQHLKTYQKKGVGDSYNQYDEYKVNFKCDDCNHTWTDRVKEEVRLN